MLEPLREDYSMFRALSVDVDSGTVTWPNGADLSPRTLYEESKPAVPA